MKTRFLHSLIVLFLVLQVAWAGDLKITIPKRSHATPVQQLNREGVKAVNKHDLKKAEKLFYKAYLIDPDDPYTLNNLGYISELRGQVDRALRYYQLAAKENSSSNIAESSVKDLRGKTIASVASNFENRDLRINRGNIEAMNLLQQKRSAEADRVLQDTLALDPHNAFTLNNLGYAMETEGDLKAADRYYTEAANANSSEKIIVAPDPRWRGKGISEIAARNARAVEQRMSSEQTVQDEVARLNLQGVSALNHNDRNKARELFEKAYALDKNNAFSLNNMGYVAELDGDQETANELYAEARKAEGANAKATVTSKRQMRGLPLTAVAETNSEGAEATLEAERQQRQREGGPILLRRRDNSVVTEPETPPAESPGQPPAGQTQTPPQTQPSPQTAPPTVQPPVTQPPQGATQPPPQ